MMNLSEFLAPRPKFVYALIDPHDWLARYVGQAFSPETRLRQHVMSAQNSRCLRQSRMERWIRDLWSEGLCPDIEVLEMTSEDMAETCEQLWIAHYIAGGADLLNPNLQPDAYKGAHLIREDRYRSRSPASSCGSGHDG